MPTTTLSSRELNHDVSRAKKAAEAGPVIITDRGRPSHVLLTYEAYSRLSAKPCTFLEALSMPGLADIDFSPDRATIFTREIDLS